MNIEYQFVKEELVFEDWRWGIRSTPIVGGRLVGGQPCTSLSSVQWIKTKAAVRWLESQTYAFGGERYSIEAPLELVFATRFSLPIVLRDASSGKPVKFDAKGFDLIASNLSTQLLDADETSMTSVEEYLFHSHSSWILITSTKISAGEERLAPSFRGLSPSRAANWLIDNRVEIPLLLRGELTIPELIPELAAKLTEEEPGSIQQLSDKESAHVEIDTIAKQLDGLGGPRFRFIAGHRYGVTFREFKGARDSDTERELTTSRDDESIAAMIRKLSRELEPFGWEISAQVTANRIRAAKLSESKT